jgi:hypothetical protein
MFADGFSKVTFNIRLDLTGDKRNLDEPRIAFPSTGYYNLGPETKTLKSPLTQYEASLLLDAIMRASSPILTVESEQTQRYVKGEDVSRTYSCND